MASSSCIDPYASREGRFLRCEWRKKSLSRNGGELGAERKPSGIFYAKEESARFSADKDVGGAFLFDNDSVTISTSDFVDGIEHEDLVRMEGEEWIVENVQRRRVKSASQFSRKGRYVTYLRLRR